MRSQHPGSRRSGFSPRPLRCRSRALARRIQAGAAGARLRRRENSSPRGPPRRGRARTTPPPRPGAGGAQARRDRGDQRCRYCGGQTRNSRDPDRDGTQRRSRRSRVRGQPRAPKWKRHWAQHAFPGTQWEEAGAAAGGRPRALARRAPLESDSRGNLLDYKETEVAARSPHVELQSIEVSRVEDLDRAFSEVTQGRAQALIVASGNPVTVARRAQGASFAQRSGLPSIYGLREYVDDGGLMSYGPSTADLYRRAATYVDKILKGTKPADLPVEQPTKFELGINLKTAKALGLTIPPSLLARADQVI